MRGAVMRGLQDDAVTKRLARRSYGTEYKTPFVNGLHPERNKVWDRDREEFMCTKRVKWLIKKVILKYVLLFSNACPSDQ